MSHVYVNGERVGCKVEDLFAMDELVVAGKYATREEAAFEVLGIKKPAAKKARKKGGK